MYMNMQPKKWKCREHKKAFLEADSLQGETQEHNSFEVYGNSKGISRYNTSFLESAGCVRNFAGCNLIWFVFKYSRFCTGKMCLYDFLTQLIWSPKHDMLKTEP